MLVTSDHMTMAPVTKASLATTGNEWKISPDRLLKVNGSCLENNMLKSHRPTDPSVATTCCYGKMCNPHSVIKTSLWLLWSLTYCSGHSLSGSVGLVYKHGAATLQAEVKLWKYDTKQKRRHAWNTPPAALRHIFTLRVSACDQVRLSNMKK